MRYTNNLLLLGVAIFIFGSIGGLVMIKAVTGVFSTAYLLATTACLILKLPISIWAAKKSNDSAIYSIIGGSLLAGDVSLILIGIGAPTFFIFPPYTLTGAVIIIFLLCFYFIHIKHTTTEFNKKWKSHGVKAIKTASTNGHFSILKYRDALELRVDLLPFMPWVFGTTLKGALIIGLLIGSLTWTKDSPMSILPLTMSALIAFTYFIQVFVIAVKQFFTLREYEINNNITLKPP